MRKVVVSEFVTMDGVFEDPGGAEGFKYGGWSMQFASDEYQKYKYEELMAADASLLGRVTYEGFAKAWPSMKSAGEFGEKINSMPKYIVSTTLQDSDLTWNNSHVLKGDLTEAVNELKQQDGRDILVAGSGMLVRALMERKLVDKLCLMIHPVVLGAGKRLFDGAPKANYRLIGSKQFSSGTVVLEYEPAKS